MTPKVVRVRLPPPPSSFALDRRRRLPTVALAKVDLLNELRASVGKPSSFYREDFPISVDPSPQCLHAQTLVVADPTVVSHLRSPPDSSACTAASSPDLCARPVRAFPAPTPVASPGVNKTCGQANFRDRIRSLTNRLTGTVIAIHRKASRQASPVNDATVVKSRLRR